MCCDMKWIEDNLFRQVWWFDEAYFLFARNAKTVVSHVYNRTCFDTDTRTRPLSTAIQQELARDAPVQGIVVYEDLSRQ
jgi:hypothetical protein